MTNVDVLLPVSPNMILLRKIVLFGVWERAWNQQRRVQLEESTSMTDDNCDGVLYWQPAGGKIKVKSGKRTVTEAGAA
jgi:hypothetical protein